RMLEGDPSPSVREALERQLATYETIPDQLPVRALDYMQQALQEKKRSLLTSGGIGMKEFIGVQDALNDVLTAVDAQSPTFAQARQTWAAFASAMDAVEMGRGLSKKAPDIIQRELASEEITRYGLQDFYRLSAM